MLQNWFFRGGPNWTGSPIFSSPTSVTQRLSRASFWEFYHTLTNNLVFCLCYKEFENISRPPQIGSTDVSSFLFCSTTALLSCFAFVIFQPKLISQSYGAMKMASQCAQSFPSKWPACSAQDVTGQSVIQCTKWPGCYAVLHRLLRSNTHYTVQDITIR